MECVTQQQRWKFCNKKSVENLNLRPIFPQIIPANPKIYIYICRHNLRKTILMAETYSLEFHLEKINIHITVRIYPELQTVLGRI